MQAQQLLPKPAALSWVDSSAYGVTYFTAYRMLVDQCRLRAGHNVLIWGGAGGLGVFATQLCREAGASAVGVVSSAAKGELVTALGAAGYIDRTEFAGMMRRGGETADEERERSKVARAFAKRVKELLGDAPDIVFEHVGKETFPTSVFTVKPFGKVVTCGATTGYMLDFDVRYLWMRQKQIIGSHAFNAYECWRANELIAQGKIRPVLWRALGFGDVPEAHRLMHANRHLGKISIMVGATGAEHGNGRGPRRDPGRLGRCVRTALAGIGRVVTRRGGDHAPGRPRAEHQGRGSTRSSAKRARARRRRPGSPTPRPAVRTSAGRGRGRGRRRAHGRRVAGAGGGDRHRGALGDDKDELVSALRNH